MIDNFIFRFFDKQAERFGEVTVLAVGQGLAFGLIAAGVYLMFR